MRLLTDEEEEILNLFRHKFSLCSATGQNNVMKHITEWTSSIKKARELGLHDLEELRKGKESFQSMKEQPLYPLMAMPMRQQRRHLMKSQANKMKLIWALLAVK